MNLFFWRKKKPYKTLIHYACGCTDSYPLEKGIPLKCPLHGNQHVVKYTNEEVK